MQKVEKFISYDNEMFDSEEECKNYEKRLIEDFLSNHLLIDNRKFYLINDELKMLIFNKHFIVTKKLTQKDIGNYYMCVVDVIHGHYSDHRTAEPISLQSYINSLKYDLNDIIKTYEHAYNNLQARLNRTKEVLESANIKI